MDMLDTLNITLWVVFLYELGEFKIFSPLIQTNTKWILTCNITKLNTTLIYSTIKKKEQLIESDSIFKYQNKHKVDIYILLYKNAVSCFVTISHLQKLCTHFVNLFALGKQIIINIATMNISYLFE